MERRQWTNDPTNNYHCLDSDDRQVQGTQQDVINLQSWTASVWAYVQTLLEMSFCFQSEKKQNINSSSSRHNGPLKKIIYKRRSTAEFTTEPQAPVWVQRSLSILMTEGSFGTRRHWNFNLRWLRHQTSVINHYLWNRSVWPGGVFPMSACRAVSCCLWRDSLS